MTVPSRATIAASGDQAPAVSSIATVFAGDTLLPIISGGGGLDSAARGTPNLDLVFLCALVTRHCSLNDHGRR